MAKVIIEIDTDTGALKASVNGKNVDNLHRVYAYKYSREGYNSKETTKVDVSLDSYTMDSEGVKTLTSVCASNGLIGDKALRVGTTHSSYDDFIVNPIVNNKEDYAEETKNLSELYKDFFRNARRI